MDEPRASIRLGVSPIIWSNDDLPSLGDEISLEQCLSEARRAGYAGIELGRKFPRDRQALRRRLSEHSLALVSGWYGGRLLDRGLEAELRAIEPQADLLSEMGCKVLVYAEISGGVHGCRTAPLGSRRRLAPSEFERYGRTLTAFAEVMRSKGLAMAYHHHMGTVVETLDEMERLVHATGDDVGLTLDTGHMAFAAAVPAEAAARLRPRIRHVHLKDVRSSVLARASAHPASYLDAVVAGVFTVPGQGDLDLRSVLEVLRDAQYRGWVVVEADQDPARAEPGRCAEMGAEYVRAAASRLGLRIGL